MPGFSCQNVLKVIGSLDVLKVIGSVIKSIGKRFKISVLMISVSICYLRKR